MPRLFKIKRLVFNIDSSAIAGHAQTLRDLSKSAFPVVVRQTLNKAAFDVKMNTMPKEVKRVFEKRKPNFFKANSGVTQAQGFNMDTMRATVGFKPKENDKSHSVEDLEQQEHGGEIANRAFIAIKGARSGKSFGGMVKRDMSMEYINSRMSVRTKSSIADSLKNKARGNREKFIRTAIATGKGGFVLGTDRKGGARKLLRINSVKRIKGDTVVNSTPIYNVMGGREVKPGSKYRHFMEIASVLSQKKMENDFINLSEKKIKELIDKRK